MQYKYGFSKMYCIICKLQTFEELEKNSNINKCCESVVQFTAETWKSRHIVKYDDDAI